MPDELSLTAAERLALNADWTAVCRRIVARLTERFAAHPTTATRAVEAGRGAGGDMTLAIDAIAEDVVFDELAQLSESGASFHAISEERGAVDLGGGPVLVVIDPIDGSLNAKRMVPSYSLSIAVATGTTMADVVYGFVYDFGAREEWEARVGAGATLNGAPLDRDATGNGLEVVGIETAKPANITAEWLERIDGRVHRLRVVGSIALTLCQVAAARFDGMLSLRACRSIDAAAGQLIVREAGGHVAFGDADDPLSAPLDLLPHRRVAAARTDEALRFLLGSVA